MHRSSYCRSLPPINDIGGNKRHSLQINVIKKNCPILALFDMVSQTSMSNPNINSSCDKCEFTQCGIDYYRILSLSLNCDSREVKDA